MKNQQNPPWSRDELIIALDFYIQHTPSIRKGSAEIADLSDFLGRMGRKLGREISERYRSPYGVYIKLMSFLRLDPDHEGGTWSGGDSWRGGQGDKDVWNRYSSDPSELERVAARIRSFVESDEPIPSAEVISDEEEGGEEGQLLTRTHRYRERRPRLVRRKKDRVLREVGELRCEVCDFDFSKVYGERGNGYIECHHTRPLSELEPGQTTKLSDLSLLCSNCHRMIHRSPRLSVEQLRQFIKSQEKAPETLAK